MSGIRRVMVEGQLPPVSHYCHVTRAGNLIWVSGAIGVAADGSVPEDAGEQMELALASIDACLKAVGAGAEHVVKVNVYLTDMADFPALNEVYRQTLREPYPARTTVAVAALPLGARIEIEMVAAQP